MVNCAPTKTATILVLGSAGLGYLDTSALYHVIRGQSVIKLYVMYNMLEVRGMEGRANWREEGKVWAKWKEGGKVWTKWKEGGKVWTKWREGGKEWTKWREGGKEWTKWREGVYKLKKRSCMDIMSVQSKDCTDT